MGKDKDREKNWNPRRHGMKSGALYGLGILGAAVYFIQTANGFWMWILVAPKAIFWPAIVVYKVLEMLKV
jgi:hypothetical protein